MRALKAFLKHLFDQPFITATGFAALIHSTWSLGTLFSGESPDFSLDPIHYLMWVVPAFLIAFSLDIGQIVTSAEIVKGERTKAKYATFFIFAMGTYYLQWLYCIHHVPLLPLAKGVSDEWIPLVLFARNLWIFIVPFFLPASTLFYTFSHKKDTSDKAPSKLEVKQVKTTEENTISVTVPPVINPVNILPPEPIKRIEAINPPEEVTPENKGTVTAKEKIKLWFLDGINADYVTQLKEGQITQKKVAEMIGVNPVSLNQYIKSNK